MKQLLQKLKKKILENLQLKDAISDELADDTLFFNDGLGLDSTDLLALATSVDRDNGAKIFYCDLGKKVFITLSTLTEYNIYPSQIAEVLKRYPKIKDWAVIGAPDRIKEHAMIAVIVVKEDMKGNKEEFLKYSRDMPDYSLSMITPFPMRSQGIRPEKF